MFSGARVWRCWASGDCRHALPGGALARSEATGRSATGRCCSTRSRFLVVGTQLLSLGVLAELVTAYNIRAEDTYSMAETIPAPASDPQDPIPGSDMTALPPHELNSIDPQRRLQT